MHCVSIEQAQPSKTVVRGILVLAFLALDVALAAVLFCQPGRGGTCADRFLFDARTARSRRVAVNAGFHAFATWSASVYVRGPPERRPWGYAGVLAAPAVAGLLARRGRRRAAAARDDARAALSLDADAPPPPPPS